MVGERAGIPSCGWGGGSGDLWGGGWRVERPM